MRTTHRTPPRNGLSHDTAALFYKRVRGYLPRRPAVFRFQKHAPGRKGNFIGLDFHHIVFVATVAARTRKRELLRPGFWAAVADRIRPYDRVIVITEDDRYWAELLFTGERVCLLRFVSLPNARP